MGLLDVIVAEARKVNMRMDDLGVHQVLYRTLDQEHTLNVVLIDAERIKPV